ncbi:MAG TPA: hypothetical protein PLR65_16165, partial [Anaerolineales bacterium]|nr:hypothetical protein [Anaerolineales bacterium]
MNPLPIPASSGLAESVHVVFFSDNIVGAEFNFYGPRASKLPHYLSTKARDAAPNILHFDQLLRKDAAEQFREIRGIKVFQFKIKASYAESIKRANKGLSDALKAAREASHADEIEIILKPKAHSRDILSRRLIGAVQRMLPAKDLHQEASKLYVEGYGDDRESLIKLDL